jgi:hypothetical protein
MQQCHGQPNWQTLTHELQTNITRQMDQPNIIHIVLSLADKHYPLGLPHRHRLHAMMKHSPSIIRLILNKRKY